LNAASPTIGITDCDYDNIELKQHVFAEKLKQNDFEIISTTLCRAGEETLREAFGQESLKYRQSANPRQGV
jgi:methylmalonyl-CoA mutase cobalamin-binding subunit